MPGLSNNIPHQANKVMTNWWVFTAKWDSAITNKAGLYELPDYSRVPEAPYALEATAKNANTIELCWVDNSINETDFVVEKSTTPNSTFAAIDSVKASQYNYSDATLQLDIPYYFRIRARNKSGISYSNVASVIIGESLTTSMMAHDAKNIHVYPNPTTNKHFTITITGGTKNASMLITDAHGKLVYPETKIESSTVNFSADHLPPGIYFLLFKQGDRLTPVKFIVNK